MTLEQLKEVFSEGYDKVIDKVKSSLPAAPVSPTDAISQLDVKEHPVMKIASRPDKIKEVEDDDGKKTTSTVFVARIPVPMQKLIVRRAASFLCGNPIKLDATTLDEAQEQFVELMQRTWDDNKLDYRTMALAKMMMGETQCAELWYVVPADEGFWGEGPNKATKFKYKVKLLAPSLGDGLYPVFDDTGDMIAFGREYKVKSGDDEIEHFDLYTAEQTVLGVKEGQDWTTKPEPNQVKKIPVIYYSQLYPEWYDVQASIDRLEKVCSNSADTNDYFASPMVAASGEVTGFADKDDQGKVLKLENGAKVEYLTWDQAPEATKMEIERLERHIYDMTDTPNISFTEMKNIGAFSGIALKMLFLGAHLKAAEHEANFGEGVQRRINFMKAALATINTSLSAVSTINISPKFTYYLPKNDQETISLLTEAVGPGKSIMSQENAVRKNPLVGDADTEIERMTEEGLMGTDIEVA